MTIPELPLRDWINAFFNWLSGNFEFIFQAAGSGLEATMETLSGVLAWAPPYVMILVICIALAARRNWRRAVTIGLSLLLIWNLGLWNDAMVTVSLVLIAGCFALLVGVPLGVAMAEFDAVRAAATPVLDYMQTTPAFVYLIPSVLFFGVGSAAGIVAPAIFALPPTARALHLAIREVDSNIIEAGTAFGSNRWELLYKLKLPLAAPYIRYGVNQCIMMALAMVIMASLVGAGGLGTKVIQALGQFDLVLGIESGVAVVLVAVVLDRLTGTG